MYTLFGLLIIFGVVGVIVLLVVFAPYVLIGVIFCFSVIAIAVLVITLAQLIGYVIKYGDDAYIERDILYDTLLGKIALCCFEGFRKK